MPPLVLTANFSRDPAHGRGCAFFLSFVLCDTCSRAPKAHFRYGIAERARLGLGPGECWGHPHPPPPDPSNWASTTPHKGLVLHPTQPQIKASWSSLISDSCSLLIPLFQSSLLHIFRVHPLISAYQTSSFTRPEPNPSKICSLAFIPHNHTQTHTHNPRWSVTATPTLCRQTSCLAVTCSKSSFGPAKICPLDLAGRNLSQAEMPPVKSRPHQQQNTKLTDSSLPTGDSKCHIRRKPSEVPEARPEGSSHRRVRLDRQRGRCQVKVEGKP